LEDFKAFYRRYGGKLWLILILAVILILFLGSFFLPELFWDRFIYRYYWGPVEVDALESGPKVQSDGYVIDQGYTIISEITYGIVLILALLGIYKLLKRFEIQIDLRFALSVLPFFFLGGTLRVLEDAELFREPFVYLFISPLIYFVIGALIVGVLLYGVFLDRKEGYSRRMKWILTGMIWIVFNVVYIILYILNYDGFNYLVHPFVPIIFSLAIFTFLILYSNKIQESDAFSTLFLFGLFLLAFSIFIIMLWPSVEPWKDAYLDAHTRTEVNTEPIAGVLVILISVGITICTFIVAKLLRNKGRVMQIFTDPINLLIIFGQTFDAVATFVGVDFYGYAEKHPIPDFFFQTFGTSAVFIPIKLALACVIIYLIDISFKEELKNYPILKRLIKVVIIVLGLGPGTRDMLRMMMGV
jgi:uncharacterized membrane protein